MALRTFFVITRQIGESSLEYMDWCRSWCSNPHHGKKFSRRDAAHDYLAKYRSELGAVNIKYSVTEHEQFHG